MKKSLDGVLSKGKNRKSFFLIMSWEGDLRRPIGEPDACLLLLEGQSVWLLHHALISLKAERLNQRWSFRSSVVSLPSIVSTNCVTVKSSTHPESGGGLILWSGISGLSYFKVSNKNHFNIPLHFFSVFFIGVIKRRLWKHQKEQFSLLGIFTQD